MDAKQRNKENILSLAEKTKHYCDLLIEQSDNWLSEEEGIKNIEKRLDKPSGNEKKLNKRIRNKGGKIIISILLSFSFTSVALGQDVDSLFNIFTQNEGKSHLYTANILVDRIHELGHVDKSKPLTEKDKPSHIDAIVYGAMALYCSDRAKYMDAIFHNEKSLSLYRQMNDSTRIVHKLQNLYVNYVSTGQFEKALNCLKESIDIATIICDRPMLANALLCMGSLHSHNENNKAAIECIEKGLAINRELGNMRMIIWSLSSLSNLYLDIDNLEKAKRYTEEAFLLCEQEDRISLKINCWINMALIHHKEKEWNKSIEHLNSALREAEKNEFGGFINLCLLHLGDVYIESGKNKTLAENYLLRCVDESEKNNREEDLMLAYDKLYLLHKTHNTALALDYLEKSTKLFKHLQKEETQNQLNNFHIQYQTAEKELEIERQNNVIKQQSLHRFILLMGFIISLIILILLWYVLTLRNKRNRMLAEMNATKDRFFSIVSHDLKNPAIAQRDALEQLINYSDRWDSDSLTQYYKELLKSADGQVELLYNLLNWAQVQTGRMPYNPTRFDMTSELRSDIALIKNMADRKGILLDIRVPETAILSGDRNMLTTIVRNLLTNAVKFTGKNGHITLEIKPDENCNYTISVSDTGRGMNREQIENLFNIDRQRSQRGTEGEQGSGLGLIVCKELIEKHGSRLHVESEEGKGSCFSFVLQTKI
ncbi:hypothetical protein LJC06_00520 [Bacteroidales bacterium OttesenSCG-928-I14]|nr:hypothetical protein [Bacteroidales bacterium OttesenSCG-928-I14]